MSNDELRTGAIVLLGRRDGGEVVDLVGMPIMRSESEIDHIDYYAYGSIVARSNTPGVDYDTAVSIIDRSSSWQIVGGRVDRQYWHGGLIEDSCALIGNRDEHGDIQVGSPVMFAIGAGDNKFALSLVGYAPLGGVWAGIANVCIYDGEETVSDNIRFNTVNVGVALPFVKAIPVKIDGWLYVRVLYPYDSYSIIEYPYLDMRVYGPQGEELREDYGGPYNLQEI